jgi:amidohydrolase
MAPAVSGFVFSDITMLDDLLPALSTRIASLRRDIHAHPELAFDEHRTAAKVAEYLAGLSDLGVTVETGVAKTGVVACLRLGSSPRIIALRADMDALPLTELNTFDHHSRHPGRMHACGHDGHTAMLLGAAEALAHTRRFDGTVIFIFQPAEEGEGGGRVMIEEGLFERYPAQMVFGLHNWPGLPAGQISVTEGPVMAGTDRFELTITGKGGHAAMPHQAVDVVVAGSALVQALQTLVSRVRDPLEPAVISVTRFHAGSADNVLPESAVLGGTVRALTPDIQAQMESGITRICEGVAATFGVHIAVRYSHGYPPTINAAAPSRIAREVAGVVVGDSGVRTDLKPSMGAEDFAYLARAVPGCYVWLGNGHAVGAEHGARSGCMLHSPHYDFNDEIIETGIRYWVQLVETCLSV